MNMTFVINYITAVSNAISTIRVSMPCRDATTVDALAFGTSVHHLIIVYTRPA